MRGKRGQDRERIDRRFPCGRDLGEILRWMRTDPARRPEGLTRHLDSGCPSCRERLAWLRQVLETASHGPLEEPPERVLREATRLFATLRGRPATSPLQRARDAVRTAAEAVATLVWDSFRAPQLAGVRSVATGRDLVYQTPERDLRLHLETLPGGRRIEITGQLFAREPAAPCLDYSVRVFIDGEPAGRARADAHGGFRLMADAAQVADLELQDAEIRMRIANLPLTPPD